MSTAGHVKLMKFLNLRSSPINGGNATRRGGPTPDRPTSSRLSYWTGSRSRMSTAGHVKLVPPHQLTTLLVDRLSISNEHCRSCETDEIPQFEVIPNKWGKCHSAWRSHSGPPHQLTTLLLDRLSISNEHCRSCETGPAPPAHDSLSGQALDLE